MSKRLFACIISALFIREGHSYWIWEDKTYTSAVNGPLYIGYRSESDMLSRKNPTSPTVTMAQGSSAYRFVTYNSSTLILDGILAPDGNRASVIATDNSTAVMKSGTIDGLRANKSAIVTYLGGNMGVGSAYDNGAFIAQGGKVTGLVGGGFGSLTSTDTEIIGEVILRNSSSASLSGGSIGVRLTVQDQALATLTGLTVYGAVSLSGTSQFAANSSSIVGGMRSYGGTANLTSTSIYGFSTFESNSTVDLVSVTSTQDINFEDSMATATSLTLKTLTMDGSTINFSDLNAGGSVSLDGSNFKGTNATVQSIEARTSVAHVAGISINGNASFLAGSDFKFSTGLIDGNLNSNDSDGVLEGVTLNGRVEYSNGGTLEASTTSIGGRLSFSGTSAKLYQVEIGGDLQSYFASEFQYSKGTVGGKATANGSQFWLSDVSIVGSLTATSSDLHFDNSSVADSLVAAASTAKMSGSRIGGDAYLGPSTTFEIETSTFGSNLGLSSSSGTLKDVIVDGSLAASYSSTINVDESEIGLDISVESGSSATLRDTTIRGNVSSLDSSILDIAFSTEGSIGGGASAFASSLFLNSVTVGHDVSALTSSTLNLTNTEVGGNLTAVGSSAHLGNVLVKGEALVGADSEFVASTSSFKSLSTLNAISTELTDVEIAESLNATGEGSLFAQGVTVGGNVSLAIDVNSTFQNSTIGGSLAADRAGDLEVSGGTILGNTDLTSTNARFRDVTFGNRVFATGNPALSIIGGSVNGSVQIEEGELELDTTVTGDVVANLADLKIINGKVLGNVRASGRTYEHMSGEVAGRVEAAEDVDAELQSGSFGSLSAEGTSALYLRSGTVIGDAEVSGDAYLINQSAIAGDGIASGNGHMRMYDGLIAGNLIARDTASIIVYDGVIGGQIFASGSSTIIVRGVSYGDGQGGQGFMDTSLDDGLATLTDQAKILFVGNGLGAELVDGAFDGLYSKYAITGTLANGSDLSGQYFYVLNGSGASYELQAVPEPGTISLAVGLGLYGLAKRRRQKRQAV